MVLNNIKSPHLGNRELHRERMEHVAHDFCTPLNIINGFTELLLEEGPGKINKEQRRALNDILDSGHRLLDLVNQVFDSSSPEHQKLFRRR